MNTDTLVQDEISMDSTQNDMDCQKAYEASETEELADPVTISAENEHFSHDVMGELSAGTSSGSMDGGLSTQYVESVTSEELQRSGNTEDQICAESSETVQRLHGVDAIPDAVLMEAVEEIANPTSENSALVQALPEQEPKVTEELVMGPEIPEGPVNEVPARSDIIDQVGQLTRNLHNSLRELGYDKKLESFASEVPEAQDKLSYVASKTEQAAERTLNATEVAMPIQEKLASGATQLSEKWKNAFEEQSKQPDTEKFKLLLIETLEYIDNVPDKTDATNAQLMEIMMAQDFQDLTGQVIKKITTIIHRLENDLLQLLLANVPPEKRHVPVVENNNLLNGPVTNPEKQSDTVSSQDQVDDLLASLGF